MQPVVFITGGSRGIGKAMVEKFKSHHFLVAACATTAAGAKQSGADLSFVCDVADPMQVSEAIQSIMTTFKRLDVVINNAGIAASNFLTPDASDEEWHQTINVNLNGTYYVAKHAIAHLPDHTGRIINISSVLGLKGAPETTAYCATKHAVIGFTKSLAQTLASRRITVNVICPGWVRTDMAAARMKTIGLTEEDLKTSVPLGRFIEPHEVADLAYYLATSTAAANITGQAITIDGGFLA